MDDVHVYEKSSHVAVLCKNQFYFFPALWPDSGHVAVDQADIHAILVAIMDHAEKQQKQHEENGGGEEQQGSSNNTALGVLTSLPRKEWAVARQELVQASPVNKQSLHVIDSALFVLVLDDYSPPDIHETSASMLHGTNRLVKVPREEGRTCVGSSSGSSGDDGDYDFVQYGTCLNRWYDKLQLIICKDGTAGVNFEHAAIDGHTALRFVSDIFAETVISFAESITHQVHGAGSIPHVIDASFIVVQ